MEESFRTAYRQCALIDSRILSCVNSFKHFSCPSWNTGQSSPSLKLKAESVKFKTESHTAWPYFSLHLSTFLFHSALEKNCFSSLTCNVGNSHVLSDFFVSLISIACPIAIAISLSHPPTFYHLYSLSMQLSKILTSSSFVMTFIFLE